MFAERQFRQGLLLLPKCNNDFTGAGGFTRAEGLILADIKSSNTVRADTSSVIDKCMPVEAA